MTVAEVREKYLEFFKARGHTIIPSASLVPENDPTTLFTGSGMQPLVPYLLGEPHPQGKRLADSQKCFRSEDIEEVGDNRHTTFFEMLGNWSLGDYFKKEQLRFIFEFLVDSIGLDPKRLYCSIFAGDEKSGIPKDTESAGILKGLFEERDIRAEAVDTTPAFADSGTPFVKGDTTTPKPLLGKEGGKENKIFYYDAEKNWWSRAGAPEKMPVGEPGGPDSEIFFDFHPEAGEKCIRSGFGEFCHPNCDCGRFMEIGNSVFMEYRKVAPRTNLSSDQRLVLGTFEKLPQRNVDFGGGLERITAAVNDEPDVFQIDVFKAAIKNLETYTEKKYEAEANRRSYRIVLDHIRAAVFLMADGVMPSNTDAGYFVRRLLRRAILHLDKLKMGGNQLHNPLDSIVTAYKTTYPNLLHRKREIEDALNHEEQQFRKTLEKGRKIIDSPEWWGVPDEPLPEPTGSFKGHAEPFLSGKRVFDLYQTYGFPFELTREIAREKGIKVDEKGLKGEIGKHQEVSRAGVEKKFKGGLADTSEMSVRYHTATHLLHQALRDVLGDEVRQKGSNITLERLRFDFTFPRKMTEEERKRVEDIVNKKIRADLPVHKITLPLAEAKQSGALHFFDEKYPDQVLVRYIGESLESAYSKEFCGGPHIANTSALGGGFRIVKEEAVSAGVRRIKAVLNN